MLIEQLRFDELLHSEALHSKCKGYITLATKVKGYEQWHYRYAELLEHVKANQYISQNTFYKPARRLENIKELRALYVDIDCYKSGITKEAVIYSLEHDYFNITVPIPSMIIDSGRGLYLIWLIKPVPSMALPLWRAIEQHLYEQLKEFGADSNALDPTRVLRIVGTVNTKSHSKVKLLRQYEYEYELREIQENFLPELPKKQKSGRPKQIVCLFNEYSLYYARLKDIITICELREWALKGHRELILFLYRYWSCHFTKDPTEALQAILGLNKMFLEPLTEREAKNDTKSAERAFKSKDKQYKYKNETLINLLDITEDEQRHLKTIISKTEANRREKESKRASRRNAEGLTPREQRKADKAKAVKELRAKGLKPREIGEVLNLPGDTLRDYLYR